MIKLSPLDMNYGSMTFPGLITPTAVWPGLWCEALEGGKFRSQPAKPRAPSSCFYPCGSHGYVCGQEILLL